MCLSDSLSIDVCLSPVSVILTSTYWRRFWFILQSKLRRCKDLASVVVGLCPVQIGFALC